MIINKGRLRDKSDLLSIMTRGSPMLHHISFRMVSLGFSLNKATIITSSERFFLDSFRGAATMLRAYGVSYMGGPIMTVWMIWNTTLSTQKKSVRVFYIEALLHQKLMFFDGIPHTRVDFWRFRRWPTKVSPSGLKMSTFSTECAYYAAIRLVFEKCPGSECPI